MHVRGDDPDVRGGGHGVGRDEAANAGARTAGGDAPMAVVAGDAQMVAEDGGRTVADDGGRTVAGDGGRMDPGVDGIQKQTDNFPLMDSGLPMLKAEFVGRRKVPALQYYMKCTEYASDTCKRVDLICTLLHLLQNTSICVFVVC